MEKVEKTNTLTPQSKVDMNNIPYDLFFSLKSNT